MQKIILGTSLILATLLNTGCGDSDDAITYEDIHVEYKDAGAYDLSHYMFPNQNQTNYYVENVYTNKNGKRSYNKIPDEDSTIYPTFKYDVNGSTIQEFNDGKLETTYTILSNEILAKSVDETETEDYARFADLGTYIVKIEGDMEDIGHLKSFCKLAKHYDSKEISGKTYHDIIELSCTMESYDSATVGGSKIEVFGDGVETRLLAKDIGVVSDVTDYCFVTKSDGTKTKASCVKLTQDITNHD